MTARVMVEMIKLNDGTLIPKIAFGTGTALFGSECTALVLAALKDGYRSLDGAQGYGNSESIGQALKQWGGKREDVYVLTKFGISGPPESYEPRNALNSELKKLGLSHVDMFLMHNPTYVGRGTLAQVWKTMETLKKEGLTKSIGVSNFREEDIKELEKTWEIPPAVNQIEYHPYVYHPPNMLRLREVLDKYQIKIQSYGPQVPIVWAPGGPVDPVVEKIAKDKGVTPGQVLLAWASQKGGGPVVTTSRNDGRRKEQLEAFIKMKALTGQEVEEISDAGKGKFERHFQRGVWDKAKP